MYLVDLLFGCLVPPALLIFGIVCICSGQGSPLHVCMLEAEQDDVRAPTFCGL